MKLNKRKLILILLIIILILISIISYNVVDDTNNKIDYSNIVGIYKNNNDTVKIILSDEDKLNIITTINDEMNSYEVNVVDNKIVVNDQIKIENNKVIVNGVSYIKSLVKENLTNVYKNDDVTLIINDLDDYLEIFILDDNNINSYNSTNYNESNIKAIDALNDNNYINISISKNSIKLESNVSEYNDLELDKKSD